MTLRTFLSDDSAAVTVDWVVISAAALGLGLAAATAVRTGVVALGEGIGGSLSGASVARLGSSGNPILAGVGTSDCDWYCIFAAFHEAENGPYDPAVWGPDVNRWADARLEEFRNYSTAFLHDVLRSYDGITPQNTPEPYYSTYQAEAQIIRNIIAARGG